MRYGADGVQTGLAGGPWKSIVPRGTKLEGEVELNMFHVEQDLAALPNRQDHLGRVRERNGL
jgi:hypothetical protein